MGRPVTRFTECAVSNGLRTDGDPTKAAAIDDGANSFIG